MTLRTNHVLLLWGVLPLAALGAESVLVCRGATWRYLDNGSNQGVAWVGTNLNFELVGSTALIAEGAVWRFHKGSTWPGQNWAAPTYDDSGWTNGPSGFGYGDNDDATPLSDMTNNYVSVSF